MDRLRVRAHLRSDSGPELTRFALDFAPHAGGDLLWLAYVPDGLRAWFRRFADSCDPTKGVHHPFRVARLFDSPSLSEIEFLVGRIRSRGQTAGRSGPQQIARAGRPHPLLESEDISGATRAVADEIDGGRLHVTTIVVDVHHLPILTSLIRPERTRVPLAVGDTREGWDRYVVLRLRALLTKLREANLHFLITTPLPQRVDRGRMPLESRLIDAIEAEVDLSLVVGRGSPSWEQILPLRSPTSWWERLNQTCPRIADRAVMERSASATYWADQTQEEFAALAQSRGWMVRRAASEEDRREHWDFEIERASERYRVDVKGQSRLRRGDASPQDDWHWIELRGVVDDGWLFAGKADLIAFRTEDSFILVPRTALIDHVHHHVDPDDLVSDQPSTEYRLYHRRDRSAVRTARSTGSDRGVLTLVPTNRLRMLGWAEWPV